MNIYIHIYLEDAISNLVGALNDVFNDADERINIKGLIIMVMGALDSLQDHVVRYGEEAAFTFKVLSICGHCVGHHIQKQITHAFDNDKLTT